MAWSSPRTWVTAETVTAAHMNQEIRDNLDAGFPDAVSAVSWSPVLQATSVNPTTASVTGRYYQVGAMMFVWARWFDVGAGNGNYFVTLPVAASGLTGSGVTNNTGQVVGSFRAIDNSAPANTGSGEVVLNAAATGVLFAFSGVLVTGIQPFTWQGSGGNDVLTFQAVYPVA